MLCFAMGLGKTRVAVDVAAHYNLQTLVICPSIKVDDWCDEFKRWQNIDAIAVKSRDDNPPLHGQYIVMSYAIARALAVIPPSECVICDESHALKERNAAQTKKIVPLLIKARVALLLTGTPQLSRPCELWSQLRALDPKTWGSWIEFTTRYCDGHDGPFGWDARGASHLDELKRRIEPYVITETKDVLEKCLPPKTRHFVQFDLPQDRLAELETLRANLIALQRQVKTVWDKQKADAAMMKLWFETSKSKIESTLGWFTETLGKEKMGVFAHHAIVLDAIEDYCVKQNITYVRIDGKIAGQKRQRLVHEAADIGIGSAQVALLSLTACAAGITLCPGIHRICFAELSWNPSLFDQAEDRIHRIGAIRPCEIYYLIAKHTFDQDMMGILARKRNMATLDMPAFKADSVVEFYQV